MAETVRPEKQDPTNPEVHVGAKDARLWQDALLTLMILAIIPTVLGALGYDLFWFVGYIVSAAIFLTAVVWSRERKHAHLELHDLTRATLIRMVLVLLVGGPFLILGWLAF